MSNETLAAVDLGSNSFRLQIARAMGDQIYELDSHKEAVRLAAGLDQQKNLTEESQALALATLSRFGERLRGFDPDSVRAVGTNTLRVAKNAAQFLTRAEAALGFPIEVIAGREEARLIYVGVAHALPATKERRLVVDIGGGSTECIIGTGTKPLKTESLYMGCVSYTQRFFPDGRLTRQAFEEAEIDARSELETISAPFHELGWRRGVASSGTARAIAEMLRAHGWGDGGITAPGLAKLTQAIIKIGDIRKLALPGLTPDRAPVIAGGVAIMNAVFDELKVDHMVPCDYALRHGVLYDLMGRSHDDDMRERTVAAFMKRYEVDQAQAGRVEKLSRRLYRAIKPNLPEHQIEHDEHVLAWAARLHEIGISIAYSGYHKHSAYVLQSADMPGFSRMDQAHLASIVLAHRSTLAKVQATLASPGDRALVAALRLAVLLCRGRGNTTLPQFKLVRKGESFRLHLRDRWLAGHPLTAHALAEEIAQWVGAGVDVKLKPLL